MQLLTSNPSSASAVFKSNQNTKTVFIMKISTLMALFAGLFLSAASYGQCPESLFAGPTNNCHVWNFEIGSSSGNPVVNWNFGDGMTVTAGHFMQHNFILPGTYQVCATFANANCPNGVTHCQTVVVSCNCTAVQLNFNSNMANQGPSFVQWYASVYQGNTYNQGVCQFSSNDQECSATLCLENGCYTFLVTAPNAIAPWINAGFSVNVTVGGQTVTQQLQSYNPGGNQYTFTIGVNYECVACTMNVNTIQEQDNILVLEATDIPPELRSIGHKTANK